MGSVTYRYGWYDENVDQEERTLLKSAPCRRKELILDGEGFAVMFLTRIFST